MRIKYDDAENPCEDAVWPTTGTGASSSATSTTLELTDGGDVALLCVRTTSENNPSENLSFGWAVTPPAAPAPATDSETPDDRTGLTKSVTWGAVTLPGGFDYEFRAVADPARDNFVTGDDGTV